ncbi:Ltp family lipoprotein [Leifsonia sp. 2MCAF36]|uniref:Ltp family lipoprotein n=1 Tax=Leifsonia sp. 2MCAF36 TaxID=3232988 RepID=UPI003F9CA90F
MRTPIRLLNRHKLLAIAAVALAALVVGPVSSGAAVAPFSETGGQVAATASTKVVPNVVGKTAYVAKNTLKKGGLGYAYSAPKGSFVVLSKDWTVTKQSPKASARVKAGTKVKLTVVKTASLHSASPTPATPAAPAMSPSQLQAVMAAKAYLSSGMGFSRQGLIDQLTSSYGNGFPVADATLAVDSLNPDWNAQAVVAAKAYMSSGQGFSHDSLLDQLTSPYGNNFTPEQAAYAVGQVGL